MRISISDQIRIRYYFIILVRRVYIERRRGLEPNTRVLLSSIEQCPDPSLYTRSTFARQKVSRYSTVWQISHGGARL